jgi:IclR family transcriptional regulator, acetate operon repressor
MPEKSEGTASLEKALDVLDAIGSSSQGLSQVELAAKLALPRTTLYRLLASLSARGLIRRDPARRVYCLGFKCFEFARKAHAMPDLAAAANSELRALRDLTGETSYLAVLDGTEALSIERIDGAHSQRSNSKLGERKPLHCTSQGKAMLSALPDEQRDRLVKTLPLKALTEHTITDRRRLAAELKITSARGYAIDDEEIVNNVRCVAAPIIDSAGQVRGAMSVAGPAWRMTRARLDILGPEVAEAARRVGAQLTLQKSTPPISAPKTIEGSWAFQGGFPRWSSASQTLFWTDSLAPTLRAYKDGVDKEIMRLDYPVCGLVILRTDALLLAFEQGYLMVDKVLGKQRAKPALTPWPEVCPTALCTDSNQTIFICLAAPANRYRVGAWEEDMPFQAQWILNQPLNYLAWDPTGTLLYGLNSESGEIVRMQVGQPTVRRLASIPKGSGTPCGLAVDQDGGVWTTLKDGWGIVRLSPDGNIDKVVSLPVPCPSDLALADGDHKEIFVTSARQSMSVESLTNAPLSGHLFSVTMTDSQ